MAMCCRSLLLFAAALLAGCAHDPGCEQQIIETAYPYRVVETQEVSVGNIAPACEVDAPDLPKPVPPAPGTPLHEVAAAAVDALWQWRRVARHQQELLEICSE